jgi:hypothetical protein
MRPSRPWSVCGRAIPDGRIPTASGNNPTGGAVDGQLQRPGSRAAATLTVNATWDLALFMWNVPVPLTTGTRATSAPIG